VIVAIDRNFVFGISVIYTRAIRKVTSGELLTKQIMINKIKLLLNVIAAGIEALVLSENKFIYARVKEVYRL
jgi:hypothetical protein